MADYYNQPSAYGATYQNTIAPSSYSKGMFLRSQRRSLNIVPLFICIAVPWIIFAVVAGDLSFSFHHDDPGLCYIIVAACAIALIGVGWSAVSSSGRWFSNAEREPSWLIFLFGSMLLAFVVAFVLGSWNYSHFMLPYYNMQNLNNYTDVYPTRMRGQQLMDAGIIEFTAGSHLDISKSMGFRNDNMFCVAPITKGSAPLATYDFWAVGTDCCSGNKANFHCPNFNNPHATGGLRLMGDSDRAFYRLAVQQAEATYGIKAVHPLFFVWDVQPSAIVEGWSQTGRTNFIHWILAYFIFQTFAVAVASLAFAKIGHS